MKKFNALLVLSTLVFAIPTFADESGGMIDLKQEGKEFFGLANKYLKSISSGEGISFSFQDNRPHYVERLLISAIGQQSQFSFVKVYADGEEVATLGVPGRDPDYPIVIRGQVSNITLKAQDNSKVKILDFKIFTDRKEYSSYQGIPRTQRSKFSIENWGGKVLDIALEIENLRRIDTKISIDDVKAYVLPMKKVSFKLQASDNARDARSLHTKDKARELVGSIDRALELFESDSFLLDQRYDMLILDLETIKQDIGDKYDIKVD
jgi:hypothetical protein